MSRLALPVTLLTLLYLTILGSLDPWDVLLGAGFSLGLVVLSRRFVLPRRPSSTPLDPAWPLRFVIFAAAVGWEIASGSWAVLGVVLRIRAMKRTGVVAIPIESRTRTGLVVSTLVVTIAPGTYLLDIDRERSVMLIHALDASHPDALREHFHRFYERYQRRLFP